MNKGFTLVELSIVLVIIGLLIGGILVGQSLIESAKMQSFVRQIAQYDALTATFKSKYKNLPGDSSVWGCTNSVDNTCNNGVIEATIAGPTAYFALESSLFWKQLSDSGFRPSGVVYTDVVPVLTVLTGTATPNVPKAQIGTAGVAVYGAAANANLYLVGNYGADFAVNSAPGLSAVDSLAYDSKTDDGAANAGNVVVGLATASALCNTTATYAVGSGATLVCSLAIRMAGY